MTVQLVCSQTAAVPGRQALGHSRRAAWLVYAAVADLTRPPSGLLTGDRCSLVSTASTPPPARRFLSCTHRCAHCIEDTHVSKQSQSAAADTCPRPMYAWWQQRTPCAACCLTPTTCLAPPPSPAASCTPPGAGPAGGAPSRLPAERACCRCCPIGSEPPPRRPVARAMRRVKSASLRFHARACYEGAWRALCFTRLHHPAQQACW